MLALETLKTRLHKALDGKNISLLSGCNNELVLTVDAQHYLEVVLLLRNDPDLHFEQLVDLCGVDYSTYAASSWAQSRFAVVLHLLSIKHNSRLRVRVFVPEGELPIVASVYGVWSSANWYEREAFDLMGIVFEGHPDLRRLLTDYGFIGHPFRKDFPVSGYVEMRYDEAQKRVIYQPVTIEPRELVPRIVREPAYAQARSVNLD